MKSSKKILIVRFSSIGDIVLTTPVIRCLKQQLPDAEVHFCTKKAFRSIIDHNPFIDKHHFLNESVWDLIRQLRAERYDYIIDLHNNIRSNLIKSALNVPSFTVHKLNLRKWLYVHWKINTLPNQHIVDRYMATVRRLGVTNDELGLDYFIADHERVALTSLPYTHQHGYIAYAIGGQHATKKLPLRRMIELCQKIAYPIVLLGGSEDFDNGEAITRALSHQPILNTCGHLTLNQSASLLEQAQSIFSHDTGLMHIAAAFKKEIYSIWGSTTPQLGMYPYKTSYTVLEKKGLACRPCSKIGYAKCPLGHFDCMNGISFDSELQPSGKAS